MRHRRAALLIVGLVIAAPATGERRPAPDPYAGEDFFDLSLEELMQLDVESASRRVMRLSETPAEAVVIRRKQILERNYRTVADLLEDLPGIDVFRNVAEEWKTMVSIRGIAGNNKFLILQNGRRLAPLTGETLPVDFNYPIYYADRVEVIWGPASALYGADAFSGIVNIITDPDAGDRRQASVAYGSNGYLYADGFASEALTEQLQLHVGFHRHESDNPDLSAAYPREVRLDPVVDFSGNPVGLPRSDRYSNATGSLSLDLRLTVGEGLTLGINHRDFEQMSGNGQLPTTTIYGPQIRTRATLPYLEYERDLTPALTSRSSLSYLVTETDPGSGYQNIFSGYERIYKYALSQIASLSQEFVYDHSETQHFVGGIAASSAHALPLTADLPFELDSSRPAEDQGFTYPGTDLPIRFYDLNSTSIGVYAQAQSEWTERTSTTFGLRYDYDSRYGSALSPRAGLVYKLAPSAVIKMLYGQSFRAPAALALYGHFGAFSGTDEETGKPVAEFFHVPNPDLDPEQARTAEVSYSQLIRSDTWLSLSAFSTWTYDLIDESTSRQDRIEFAGGIVDGTVETASNSGRGRLHGGSIGLQRTDRVGRVSLDSFAHYTYTDGTRVDGIYETPIPYLVPHKFKAGLTARMARHSLSARARYLSKTYLIRDDFTGAPQTAEIEGATIVDLTLRTERLFGVSGLSATLDLRNAFDRRYFGPGGSFSNNYVRSPQDPRTWTIGLSHRF
jgi:outer membrane receptor protein involved in Fe transport